MTKYFTISAHGEIVRNNFFIIPSNIRIRFSSRFGESSYSHIIKNYFMYSDENLKLLFDNPKYFLSKEGIDKFISFLIDNQPISDKIKLILKTFFTSIFNIFLNKSINEKNFIELLNLSNTSNLIILNSLLQTKNILKDKSIKSKTLKEIPNNEIISSYFHELYDKDLANNLFTFYNNIKIIKNIFLSKPAYRRSKGEDIIVKKFTSYLETIPSYIRYINIGHIYEPNDLCPLMMLHFNGLYTSTNVYFFTGVHSSRISLEDSYKIKIYTKGKEHKIYDNMIKYNDRTLYPWSKLTGDTIEKKNKFLTTPFNLYNIIKDISKNLSPDEIGNIVVFGCRNIKSTEKQFISCDRPSDGYPKLERILSYSEDIFSDFKTIKDDFNIIDYNKIEFYNIDTKKSIHINDTPNSDFKINPLNLLETLQLTFCYLYFYSIKNSNIINERNICSFIYSYKENKLIIFLKNKIFTKLTNTKLLFEIIKGYGKIKLDINKNIIDFIDRFNSYFIPSSRTSQYAYIYNKYLTLRNKF